MPIFSFSNWCWLSLRPFEIEKKSWVDGNTQHLNFLAGLVSIDQQWIPRDNALKKFVITFLSPSKADGLAVTFYYCFNLKKVAFFTPARFLIIGLTVNLDYWQKQSFSKVVFLTISAGRLDSTSSRSYLCSSYLYSRTWLKATRSNQYTPNCYILYLSPLAILSVCMIQQATAGLNISLQHNKGH